MPQLEAALFLQRVAYVLTVATLEKCLVTLFDWAVEDFEPTSTSPDQLVKALEASIFLSVSLPSSCC